MRKKIRKKTETGGLNQPDQVMTSLTRTYAILDKYKYHLVIGFFGIAAVMIGVSWFVGMNQSKKKDVGKALDAVIMKLSPEKGPVKEGEEPEFGSDEERFQHLEQTLADFVKEHESDPAGKTALLGLAAARLKLGEEELAQESLNQFAKAVPESSLMPIVHEGLGHIALRTGESEEADNQYRKMRENAADPYLRARALMHLGDMRNPMVKNIDTDKDPEEARELYNEALELLPESDAQRPDPLFQGIRSDIELRLDLIDLG